jgi:hypothetical protein
MFATTGLWNSSVMYGALLCKRDGPRYQRWSRRAKFAITSEDVCCESRVRAAAGPH